MKKLFSILSATLVFCLGISILNVSVFADEPLQVLHYIDHKYSDGTESPDFVEYRDTDVSKLTEGTPLLLGGMPDYNAIYNDGTNNYIGYNTNQGTVWYLCTGPYSPEILKIIPEGLPEGVVPEGAELSKIWVGGTYAGLLEANQMPVLDIQRGLALYDWEQTTVMSYLDGNWSSLQRKLESMQQG